MLKLTQEQFDSTIHRVFHELDKDRAREWRVLGDASARLNQYVDTAAFYRFDGRIPHEQLLGFILSGMQLGYELAKTESANERAELAERSNQLA